jgi:HlyD family secretion protein
VGILLATVIVGSAAAMVWWWRQHYARAVRTYTVAAGEVLAGVTVSGTVESAQKAAISSEIVAAARRVAVSEGQRVAKGAVLIELDDAVVAARCAQACARRDVSRHRLAEWRAGPRKEQIAQETERVNRAESELKYAEQRYAKVVRARATGAATASELDEARNALQKARAERAEAKASLALLQAGTRAEQIARGQAEVRLAEAEVQGLEAQRRKYVLRAPHDGVITEKRVHIGEVVQPGEVCLLMNDPRSLRVRADVQETQLAGVAVGCGALIVADAYPDRAVEGQVRQILRRVDRERGTVPVLVALEAPGDPNGPELMDGMSVDVVLAARQKRGVLVVPAEAVERRGRQALVWLRRDGTFVRRQVACGLSDGRRVEITAGLEAGDVIRLP